MSSYLFETTWRILGQSNVEKKILSVEQLFHDWKDNKLIRESDFNLPDVKQAGRPEKPELMNPRNMPKRKMGNEQGRLAMIHAVAHIEFNAINLALDAVCRFRDMPDDYYSDWISVAAEESYHFSLMQKRLQGSGCQYGDFPGHNGLWDMAMQTAHDPMVRMALVPRVMEARGLDVTPGIMKRFEHIGDKETVAALDIILHDEIGHVEVGTRWFNFLCKQRKLDAETTYFALLDEYLKGEIRCPLHEEARLAAGFTQQEITRLKDLCV